MTVTNTFIGHDRKSAFAVTDTLTAIEGRPAAHAAKFFTLCISAVLLWRGSVQWGWILGQHLVTARYDDFDGLAAIMPDLCRGAGRAHLAQLAPLMGEMVPELVLMGLSNEAAGAAAWHYRGQADFEGEAQRPGDLVISPASGDCSAIATGDVEPGPVDMIALAEAQARQLRQDHPDVACTGTGGSLLAIELGRRRAVSVRAIHRLGDFVGDPMEAVLASDWWKARPVPAPRAAA